MNRVGRRVEFIEKQKERSSRFLKRRIGVINKARELSVLCGVDACMIIKAPKDNENNDELIDTVWSSSSDSDVMVKKLIEKYKETSVKDRRNKDYSVWDYFLDKKRKAETELARLKEKNRQAFELSTWDSKFETMKEHELRDLANDLEIKIDDLKSRRELMKKNKRIKTGNDTSSYDESSPQLDQESWTTCDNNLQPVSMMEPNYLIPVANNSLHHNNNYYSQAMMNSIEDESNFNYQAFIDSKKMGMNLIHDNYYVQPIANPMGLPMLDHYTPTNSLPRFSFSDPMNHAMMSTDVPEPFVSDHNAYNFSVFGCLSMQQAYVYRNYRMENCVTRQSFYDLPSPPLMFDHSTNGHVSSQMQYSEQQPGLPYNFQ